ncbi:xanthine dehydrogenase family protein molybdopterin-binding subunit [Altererythrobacter sp. RZ02]|uniref:Xanthine dehydrogenase family protein molybdopterin-binding subunit n=1 Tax=Pontixanthobacter rizhaonensis TaxID=2730337 RepID=A0A848QQN5_9SPHN|nr:molybdopterin cofactor-binding domain-containing protein [Pontixanthobacter rizhaonensis]NMW33010.1 xanthine dehydrogenase family protein molybdopterin-binding subunit [Pontixanthobacter rizhaonensis]
MHISRRGVLVGAAVGGGLLVAWTLRPRSFPTPLEAGNGEYAFDAWLKIATDGVVTVAVPQLEMGQGVSTLLPQIVAVELGADWRQVAVEPAPPSGAYANVPLAAKWSALWAPALSGSIDDSTDILATRYAQLSRFSATADGTALAAYERPCRLAAASARAVLTAEAAERWGVPIEECQARSGFITHDGKEARFAELVEGAAAREAPSPPPLKPEYAYETPIPGQADAPTDYPRLDLPSKVDGTHLFAGDVRLPDMVYAAIKHGPLEKAELVEFDSSAVAGNDRVVGVVEGKRWLAAVATDWWSADQAVEAMKPRFDVQGLANSDSVPELLQEAARSGKAYRIARRGDNDDALGEPDIARRYSIAPAVHAPLETATATARYADGRLELWIASQAPERAREAAAKAIGLSIEDVILYPMPAGGSFDRRLEHDHAIEVALIAKEISKDQPRPVQLVWSRWQEQLAGIPRTPAAALVWAKLRDGGNGFIEGLSFRIATPPTALESGQRLFENKTRWAARNAVSGKADAMAVEGAMPPYGIADVAVDHVPTQISHSTARMRGNAHGYTAFFVESFIDETAAMFGREPLSYRIEMLGQDVRLVSCLQRAARLAEWDGGRDQSGQGLACHKMTFGDAEGRIACIATAKRDEGGVRVSKISAAVDIGRIVNLDIARQQIEGGLIFGLSLALGSATSYNGGLPTNQRLAQLDLPILANSPEIAVDFIDSEQDPFDPGELGAAVCAPAIANALFSATGLRFRRLPLFSEGF